jgi:hypothetical protein
VDFLHSGYKPLDGIGIISSLSLHLLHADFVTAADIGVRVCKQVQVKVFVLGSEFIINLAIGPEVD